MTRLDDVLATRDHVGGERFTVADITAFAGLAFADAASVAIAGDLTNLAAWRTRVGARGSVAAVTGAAGGGSA